MQALPDGGNALRGDKKKQTSRRNLGVRWVFLELPSAAIVFSRWGTYDGAALLVIGSNFCQGRWLRQLPLAGDARVHMDCARLARAEPGEPAQLCYSGVLGLAARVFGLVRPRGRPRRPVATRCPHVSVIEKKDDLRVSVHG